MVMVAPFFDSRCRWRHVFSECELTRTHVHVRYMLSPVRLSSVVCLSVVCNVRALYSAGRNFRQSFYAVWYLDHPFTKIVPGEPLRRGR